MQMEFAKYLDSRNHTNQILNSLLNVILAKRTNFVGTKTFCSALKVVQIAIKSKKTRSMIQQHIQTILFDISLPQLMLTNRELDYFRNN